MKLTGVRSVRVMLRSRISRSSALYPVGHAVGQLGLVDDDQEVEVGLVALGGVRLVDPAAPRVAAVEDDLADPRLAAVAGRLGIRILELLEQERHHPLELAPLRVGQMIEVGTHGFSPTPQPPAKPRPFHPTYRVYGSCVLSRAQVGLLRDQRTRAPERRRSTGLARTGRLWLRNDTPATFASGP